MMRPPVRYAITDDGVTIAYSVFGDGPITIVVIPGMISQLEVSWEEPRFEHFMSCLAACARVVMLDRRGTGLSDHTTASGERLDLPGLAADVRAVLDASDTDRAVLLGFSLGSMTAVQFATDYADRTSALVLIGSTPKLQNDLEFRFGLDAEGLEEWVDVATRRWGTGVACEAEDSAEVDDRYREWAARLERHTCSPGMAAASLRRAADYDVRPLLASVSAPTVVIHRTGDRAVNVEGGRYVASHIPGATYIELPGEDHTFFLGDRQAMLDAILAFLDERVAGGALAARLETAERKNAYGYGWNSLTPSEREIATLAAAGMTNTEIAERLRMSRHTVDGRLRRVFAKLDVSTRVELASEYARVAR